MLGAFAGLLSAQEKPQAEKKGEQQVRYQQAADSVDKDLRLALQELAEVRSKIAEVKPALAKESNRISADLREARRQADLARSGRDAVEAEFAKVDGKLKSWREERQYIEGLLLDFSKTYQSSQSLIRVESKREGVLKNGWQQHLALLKDSIDQVASGGRLSVIEGEALNAEGLLVKGRFADAGAVTWFLSEDGEVSGLVAADRKLRARIVPGTADAENVKLALNGGEADLSFDPTLGSAVALTQSETSIIGHIQQGGFWIFPILVLAAIALFAAVRKWLQLLSIRELRPGVVQAVIDAVGEGDFETARNQAAGVKHPAKQMLEQGISVLSAAPDTDRDDLEEALYEKFLEALPQLNRGLPLVAIASATAPLLGLLGTVTGMIETFRLINVFGTGDAKSLASGISEALVTTEFGLIVAIPALIMHALLSRKVQGIKSTMEMTSLAFLNGVKDKS
ncbi:MAG: MotA/TolQ/ExbB proton channel family protein [Verrucomicrobiales bacterium]|nr:MotA/TolQ/ExbB proton channel family protein [Verrucomicrobiales bacterium]